MAELKKSISLSKGIALAIGSIMGSGILFLPSLTYGISGNDVVLVWVLATVICLPLLLVFTDMVAAVPNERGIEGFVSLGLGKNWGAAVPLLFLGTVTIGMPSSAIIAGEYFEKFMAIPNSGTWTAYFLIFMAISVNLKGVEFGGKINYLISLALFLIGGLLIFYTTPLALPHYDKLIPSFNINTILSGVVVSFWAYAGFENLTFIAGEFKNPKRDFFLSMLIALLLCGGLYLALSANFSALVNQSEANVINGLNQLASVANVPHSISGAISLFAVLAVAINLISWTWGISRLVYSSAEQGFLPKIFAKLSNNLPKNSILFLGSLFFVVLSFSKVYPQYFQKCLVVVSTNFVYIYLLCLISYFNYVKSKSKKILALLLIIGLLFIIKSSGMLIIYPISITLFAYFISKRKNAL